MPMSNVVLFPRAAIDPEELAILAVNYIAIDEERLGRFLAHSGLDPAEIRAAADQPGFMLGVLDYVAGDERLVVDLAEHVGIRPEAVERARQAMAPRQEEFA